MQVSDAAPLVLMVWYEVRRHRITESRADPHGFLAVTGLHHPAQTAR